MQNTALSKWQLAGHMALLKNTLAFFDTQYHPKVAFINDWSLYQHIRAFGIPKRGRKKPPTLGALLDLLEPYIPFKLTEENFDLFMESVTQLEEENPLLPHFTHKAKMDFVLALRAIQNRDQWEKALSVCEAIRSLHEELTQA